MNNIKINSIKHISILCIFLSLTAYLIQEKVDGPVTARSVDIYLNIMKFKHSEYSHSLVSTNRSYYHITGYQVQNRIFFPLFLKGADLIVTSILGQGEGYEKMSMRAKDLRMKFLRAFYSMIYLFSIFAMYLLVFIFLKKYINNDESIVYTGLLFFICSVLIFIAPPKMHKVEDQLQVILFIAVLIYIIENRYISLCFITVLTSMTRESSLFIWIIYLVVETFRLFFTTKKKFLKPEKKLLGINSVIYKVFFYKVVPRCALLLFLALFSILGIRAIFFGGFPYSLGIGMEGGSVGFIWPGEISELNFGPNVHPVISMLSRFIRTVFIPDSRITWFLITSMLFISIFQPNRPKLILRIAATIIILSTIFSFVGSHWIAINMWALMNIICLLLLGSSIYLHKSDFLDKSLIIASVVIFFITAIFSNFQEARAFYVSFILLLIPIAKSIENCKNTRVQTMQPIINDL